MMIDLELGDEPAKLIHQPVQLVRRTRDLRHTARRILGHRRDRLDTARDILTRFRLLLARKQAEVFISV